VVLFIISVQTSLIVVLFMISAKTSLILVDNLSPNKCHSVFVYHLI
jgi:hypothetical protein